LFASLREIAGTSRVEVAADTVDQALRAASQQFGPVFARGLETSRVWVNGSEAHPDDRVGKEDEVVILPPVSGGSQSMSVASADLAVLLPLLMALVAILANLGDQEIWAAALVAIAGVWAVDMGAAFNARRRTFASLAVVTAAGTSAMAAHILGPTGYGLAMALAVAISLGWAITFAKYRQVDVFTPTLLVSLLAALGSASMILSRSAFTPDERAVDVFLVAVIAGVALGALVARLPAIPFLDRFTTTALSSILASVGAAALWDLDVVGYLLVGLGVSVTLVAGQGLSSMLRTGGVSLTERPPGSLSALDGAVLAAAIYFPLIRLVL
jgi:molybdopterin converting factor small subunit